MKFSSARSGADLTDAVARVLLPQMRDVASVGLGERRALDVDDVLGVEFGAPREVVGAGDHRVVHDYHLSMHEVVSTRRSVARRVLADEARRGDDLADRADLPAV